MLNRLHSNKAFTLIEVVIAVLILAGSIITLSAAWSSNLMKYNKSKRHDIAAFLLEKKMTELLVQYEGQPLESVKDEDKGDFGKEYKRFRWEFKSQEILLPDLKALYAAGKDEAPDEMTTLVLEQMRGFIEKSVKEIQLTVFVKVDKSKTTKKGRKEAKYTVSTYIVDYNQELDVPGSVPSGSGSQQ